MNRRRDEAGQVTAFVTVMAVFLIVCAGLVVDGGRLLAARRQASDLAGEAARAGAQMVSIDDLRRSNTQVLDVPAARTAAEQFLADAGVDGEVDVDGASVTVTVRLPTPMLVLGVVGMGERVVSGVETAQTVRGVSGGEG